MDLTTTADLSDPTHDPLAAETSGVVGRLAVCSIGYIGLIEGRAFCDFQKWAWVGRSIRGLPWASTRPRLLDPEEERWVHSQFDAAGVVLVPR